MRSNDRAPDAFFTTSALGRTRELTPEGFLLCRDVPIARTGEMLYGGNELPELEAGTDGIIRVTRSEEDLFRPETIASFNGKSVTDDHPEEDVRPLTWRDTEVGAVLYPRRGEGVDADCIVADLLIKDPDAIAAVQDDKREVSCGYDADYEQIGPGRARQFNIIGNHVALVDQGRCGPRCAIGDTKMAQPKPNQKRSWADRIKTAFKARDEAALQEAIEEAEARDEMTEGAGGSESTLVIRVEGAAPAATTTSDEGEGEAERREETQDEGEEAPAWFKAHVDQNNARFEKIEGALAKLSGTADEAGAEEEEEGERTSDEELDPGLVQDEASEEEDEGGEKKGTQDSKTRDSANLSAAFQDVLSRAEILAPGIRLMTFDAKANRKLTLDRMCAMRRRALEHALKDEDTADVLKGLTGGRSPDLKKLTCDAVKVMFNAGSELVRSSNSAITSVGFVHDHAGSTKPATIADINQRNREFWQSKGGLAR